MTFRELSLPLRAPSAGRAIFVGALLVFGLVMLRQLIVMYLISLGAIVIGGIGGTAIATRILDRIGPPKTET